MRKETQAELFKVLYNLEVKYEFDKTDTGKSLGKLINKLQKELLNKVADDSTDLENIDDADVVNVSLILNETDKSALLGTGAYIKIAKVLDITLDLDSPIFDEIERFIVAKFYEMEDKNNYELSNK